MNPLKVGFFGAVIAATALGIVLINNLPTIFDIVTVSAASVGGVVAGRKSAEWF